MLFFFLVFFLLFSAIMAASETSFFSLSSYTLRAFKDDVSPKKRLVAKLLERPRELLVSILMVNIFSSIMIQNIFSSLLGSYSSWFLSVGVPTFLIIFVAEIFPKSIALANNTFVAIRVARLVAFLQRVLGPVRTFLTWLTNHISRFLFFFLKKEKPLSQEELEFVLEKSKTDGTLQREESDFISRYLSLKDCVAKELMRPKEELVFFDLTQDPKLLSQIFYEKKFSHLLVCEGDIQNLIGILSFQRYFLHLSAITTIPEVKKYVEKPFYIPDSMNGWLVFDELRKKKLSMAIVVDEYGSISGAVLQEDMNASIVSDATEEKNFTRLSEDVIITSGKMDLIEFSEIFGKELVARSNVVTLGGWLTEQLEDIPSSGTKYVTDDFLFYVLEALPTHIQRIYVRRLKPIKGKG
jgi:putative hemolysin